MDLNLDKIRTKLENRRSKPVDIERYYAVTVPLIFNDKTQKWEVLYEVRSEHVSQPREVSFPGGRVEEGESFRQAAVRETCEELLIDKENIDVIGELDYLINAGVLEIRCFLIRLQGVKLEDIRPNADEVDHIFTVPLSFLLKEEPLASELSMRVEDNANFPYELIPNGKAYKFSRGKNVILFYRYNEHIIWGFTAKMTNSFIKILKSLN